MIKMLKEIHEEIRQLCLEEETREFDTKEQFNRYYNHHTGRIDGYSNALTVIENKIIDLEEKEFQEFLNA